MKYFYSSSSEFYRFSVQDFPEELRQKIERRTLQKGEALFREGDPADAIYFLDSGLVRLLNYTPSGKMVDHYLAMEGEFFAEVLMIMSVCTCTAIAETVSQILVIPKQDWLETLKNHRSLAIAFAGALTYRLHWLKVIIQLRGIRAARERVWSYLQIVAAPNTRTITLDRPLKAIASELDITPETLSRVLKQLTTEK
ncbi:MAG: Crp/Fnr family transcriptional regulator, partial [Cyanobacteria bacterium P01_F01_bin.42]